MKKILLLGLMLPILFCSLSEASWFVDFQKFSASVHGETSCQDCHGDISEKKLHPDPRNVNKQLIDFFSTEDCMTCHDTVLDRLTEGIHGSIKIDRPKDYENCIHCHDPHYQLRIGQISADKVTAGPAALSESDRACLDCHVKREIEDAEGIQKIKNFCFTCHAQSGTQPQTITAQILPLINADEYPSVTHADVACLICHPSAAAFNHGNQRPGDCRQCHLRHDEKITHDAHALVGCEACHLNGVLAVREPQFQKVLWEKQRILGTPLNIHEMHSRDDAASCQRCHTSGNEIGAAAMVLPAKSILCMPCHAATFSIGDTISLSALAIFILGLIMVSSSILSGSVEGKHDAGPVTKLFALLRQSANAVFSFKIVFILKSFFMDILLQRKLYRKSEGRWLIHSFIFLSFVFRFSWGIVALICSLWLPEWPAVWDLLDKNNPNTAFLFDLSGILILLGVTLAFVRGSKKQSDLIPDLPNQDRLALGLIAGIVAVGFVLEGMRIAMTGWPHGSGYSFLGYMISRMFSGSSALTEVYGYIWYLHAAFTGAFIAYLPFSRLLHIIFAPIVLAMTAATEAEHRNTGKKSAP